MPNNAVSLPVDHPRFTEIIEWDRKEFRKQTPQAWYNHAKQLGASKLCERFETTIPYPEAVNLCADAGIYYREIKIHDEKI
jgi:hypothetical protein